MKRIFLISLFAISAMAQNKLPETLHCDGVKFLEGLANFSDISFYFPVDLRTATSVQKNSSVVFDYSDGDQVLFYGFAKGDWDQLLGGNVEKIDGTYEDGFYWTNGYNVRARFSTSCSIKK